MNIVEYQTSWWTGCDYFFFLLCINNNYFTDKFLKWNSPFQKSVSKRKCTRYTQNCLKQGWGFNLWTCTFWLDREFWHRKSSIYECNCLIGENTCCYTGNMIQSLCWNDSANMLAALADGKFTVWYYPNTIYVDRDLASRTVFEKEARYEL